MNDSHLLLNPPSRNDRPQPGELAPRQYFEAPPPEQQETDGLIVYWRVLQRHKGVLLLAGALGTIAAILITVPQTPVFQSTVAIEIQGINEDFLNMRNLNPTMMQNSYDPTFDIQTQVRELQSRVLLERVVKKMSTVDRASLTVDKGRVSAWRQALQLGESKPASIEDAVNSADIRIKPSMTSRIVEISCDSVNPRVAAQFANSMAEEYILQNMESRWQATQKTGDWLTRQLQDLKIRLEKSEDELQSYMTRSGLMFIAGEKDRENVAEEKLRQLQAEVLKAESDRVAKQSQYEIAKSFPTESLPAVMDDKTLADYESKLTDLRRQMAEISFSLTPAHPKVQRLQAQIEAVEAALKKSRANILDRIANDHQAALNREKLLTNEFTVQKGLVSDQSAKVIHYNILKREVDTNRQIYEAMLQRVKEAGIASAMRASGIRIVDPAVPPSAPYKPNVSRYAIMGLMGGLLLGVTFVFLRERSDRNLQKPGDAAFYLNTLELGVIPSLSSDRKKRISLGKPSDNNGDVLMRPEMDQVELVTWNRKLSLLAEAFRTTLTSLLFSGRNGAPPQLIMVTSASPSEGKTTVAVNLAIALAEINRSVLLIDADMRRPRVQNIFELSKGLGLADLLRERTSEGLASDRAISTTNIPGLSVMQSGGGTSGVVSNLLHSPRLPELLLQLRNDFDSIVIDTPPALHISDARVVGRYSDAVILVVRAGKTTRDAALMVKQRFVEDGTSVLGAILNGWDPKQDVYGYKYRYYNGNGASYSQRDPVSEDSRR